MPDALLQRTVSVWTERIKAGQEEAKEFFDFAEDAEELCFAPRYEKIWRQANINPDTDLPFRMTYNKVAQFVLTFGPMLYYTDPVRTVSKRPWVPALSRAASQAWQMQATMATTMLNQYLNYTPRELGLKKHSRRAIQQALVTGRGCLWTELDNHSGLVGSFFGDVKDLIIDPDATSLEDAWWIARRRVAPVWDVRRIYGVPQEELTPNTVSRTEYAADEDKTNPTNDQVVYYEVYSKMGPGARLSGAGTELESLDVLTSQTIGDHVYLVIAPHCTRPLNLDTDRPVAEAVEWLRWPIAFWADNAWPVSCLDFFEHPRKPWPVSLIMPVWGEILFLNWAYAHMAGKVRVTCRDFIVTLKGLAKEVKQRFIQGGDLSVIELPFEQMQGNIDHLVKFLQHPEWNRNLYEMVAAIEAQLEIRLGMTPLVTGEQNKQMRTVREAAVRSAFARVRPDSMGDAVEEWQSEASRKEAFGARTTLRSNGVLGQLLGVEQAQLWDRYVAADPEHAAREFEYRVEAGSARKPNKDREVDNASMMADRLLPIYSQVAATGYTKPFNFIVNQLDKAFQMGANGALNLPSVPGMTAQPPGTTNPSGSNMQPPGGTKPVPGGAQPGIPAEKGQ